MPSAARTFYLAIFALFIPAHATLDSAKTSSPYSSDTCAIEPHATVSDTCASYATLDALNDEVRPILTSITQDTDFFSYYRLNLFNKICPFWQDETSLCGNIACAVNTIDSQEDLPPIWRIEELGKLEGPHAGHPGRRQQQERPKQKPLQGGLGEDVGESCVVEYDDECDERDYCVPEDEGAAAKGDYVSLVDNPERFTGYAGLGAHQVWDAIYRENCFVKPSSSPSSQLAPLQGLQVQAANNFRSVLHKELPQLDDECLEKRVFHRIISGMHASISTHLCWEYLNQTTDEWGPNVQCYKDRLHKHPERISNLYFNYALVARAVAKLQKHLQHYNFCSFDPDQDLETKNKVLALTEQLHNRPQIFDEAVMFQDEHSIELKEDFRNRFRNVSRLMDCVGCDKCRLWGKLQVNGYGTALKVLFEYDETKNGENPLLRRTELVALVNTLARISKSIAAVRRFREAVQAGNDQILVSDSKSEAVVEDEGVRYYRHSDSNLYPDNYEPEYEYPDNGRPWEQREKTETLAEEFWQEWRIFWNTLAWVLKSWMAVPGTVWDILVLEFNRLWHFWLGLPVPLRTWKIQFPEPREEL
ncbi:oxidoreductin [Talaromyces proteolyticus]|uniref:Oxidoreductin n=1 Tax=Talaromyces proteolyticus TaxID=1131652 RepID=A0AAD4KCZ1_9EURO|nr:oxidoreductin [Talaromyces proteolyticus]KAH8689064.1 oxidoreductin [Talaromyces proteolyticus]